MRLFIARSQIVLPGWLQPKLDGERGEKAYKHRLMAFSSIIAGSSGLLSGVVLGACTKAWIGGIFGLLTAWIIAVGIYAWLPLIFGGMRIPDPFNRNR